LREGGRNKRQELEGFLVMEKSQSPQRAHRAEELKRQRDPESKLRSEVPAVLAE
jgi:hypothetical protein